jgi:hypothetical protein
MEKFEYLKKRYKKLNKFEKFFFKVFWVGPQNIYYFLRYKLLGY